MPDQNPTEGQDRTISDVQSSPDGVTDAARFIMGLRGEAQPGAAPAALSGADDQGGGGGEAQPAGGGGGFNWDLFPDVPEAQRSLLEPHLKGVQGHVTKLEQRYAPYKSLIDGGVKAEDLQGLIQLDEAFNRDPIGTWLMLAQNMQKEGTLSGDLDLETVKAILNGETVEGEDEGGEGGGEEEEIPAWAQELINRMDAQERTASEKDQKAQAEQRQQQLDKTVEGMKSQLKEAGYEEDQIDDELLVGAIIAHKGDADKALASLVGLRDGALKGLTNGRNGSDDGDGDSGPTMPKGAPKAPKREPRGAGAAFSEARQGARQFLESELRQSAQEGS